MIDLRRLRVLRAVARLGTVTAAARALHLTPSAASQQVRQLSRELGVPLLEPSGRRVCLTPAARRLLAHADAIEERWERAEAELRATDSAEPTGVLRMCGIPTAVLALLATAAARLGARWPELTVRVREAEPLACFDLLFARDTDLAVTVATPGSPPLTDGRFDQRPLLDDPYDLLTAPDHRLAGRPDVALGDLAGEPWVLSMPGTETREMLLAVCNAAGFTPVVAHEALEWASVTSLVGQGLGVALLPRLAPLPAHPAVVRTPLAATGTPYRRVLTVLRPGSHASPAVAAALDVLAEVAAEQRAAGEGPGAARTPRAGRG